MNHKTTKALRETRRQPLPSLSHYKTIEREPYILADSPNSSSIRKGIRSRRRKERVQTALTHEPTQQTLSIAAQLHHSDYSFSHSVEQTQTNNDVVDSPRFIKTSK